MDRVVDACRRAHAWRSSHQFLGRYSVDKLQQFDQYQLQTSVARSAFVIALTFAVPIVALVTVLSIASSDPADKVIVSAQSVVGHTVAGVSLGLRTRQALGISASEAPLAVSLAVGVFAGFGSELVRLLLLLLAGTWQATVFPMGELFVSVSMIVVLFVTSYVFMKKSIRRRWTKARTYTVVVAMQAWVFGVFLLVALVFQAASYGGQLLLILAHPTLRVAAAKLTWQQTRKLNDLTTDVTISFSEIAGSLSQALCLLSVRGPELGALLVLIDLTLVSLDMYVYASREYVVDGISTLQTSAKIIEGALDALCGPDAIDEAGTSGSDARLFRKCGAIELAKARDEPATPSTKGAARAVIRRTASDSLSGNPDLIKATARESLQLSKTRRLQLKPVDHKRCEWTNKAAILLQRHGAGGSSCSVAVSPSAVSLSPEIVKVRGAEVSKQQHSPTLEANRESTTHFSEITEGETPKTEGEAVIDTRPPKSKRRSSAHAVYFAPSAEATLTATPTAAAAPVVATRGELASSRAFRRASSVFLTPRLFHDHGSKRLMNLSATPTLGTVAKSSGQAVRPASLLSSPSQVKIDGLSVTRKDQARILEQTLQLMFSLEALTVAQFTHVLVPVVVGIVLNVAWVLPGHQANLLLYDQSGAQAATMAAAATVFGALEAVPLVMLRRSTHRRYGLKPERLLSFVLEHYWMSFYGKLVAALVVAFFCLSLPYGVASIFIDET